MRQTIRALGWIIAILWVVALIFPVTVAFSFIRLIEAGNINIQEPAILFSAGKFTLSMPFYIHNSGFCDLSEINMNLQVAAGNKTISTAKVQLPNARVGEKLESSLNLSIGFDELASSGIELLTEDMDLDLNTSFHLRAAHVIAFKAAMKTGFRWGAPFYNLTVYDIAYNSTTNTFSFCLSFENHIPHQLKGSLTVSLYNSKNGLLGSTVQDLNIPFQGDFQARFSFKAESTEMATRRGIIRVSFENMHIFEGEWSVP